MVSRLSLVRTAPVSTTAATTTPWPLSTLHGSLRLCALPESGSGAVNGYQRRSTVKYGTCLKIMVSPVRVRVPPLLLSRHLQVNYGVQLGPGLPPGLNTLGVVAVISQPTGDSEPIPAPQPSATY
jgi:hypothetical protein